MKEWKIEKEELKQQLIELRYNQGLTLQAFANKHGISYTEYINFIYHDKLSAYNYYVYKEIVKDDKN